MLAYPAAGRPSCPAPSFRLVCRSVLGQQKQQKANAQLPHQGVVLAYPAAGPLLWQELTLRPTCQTDSSLTTSSLTRRPPLVKLNQAGSANPNQQAIIGSSECVEDTQTDQMVALPSLPPDLGLQVFGQGKENDPFSLLDAHVAVQANHLHPG